MKTNISLLNADTLLKLSTLRLLHYYKKSRKVLQKLEQEDSIDPVFLQGLQESASLAKRVLDSREHLA